MFPTTFETLAKQEIQQVVCDLPDQMGGFGGQRRKQFSSNISSKFRQLLMYPRTSRRNGCCSDQQSFHQLLKVVGENGLEWQAIVRKKTPWWNQEVKEAIRAKKDGFKAWLQDRSSSDLQFRYTAREKWQLRQYKNPRRSLGKSLVVGWIPTPFFRQTKYFGRSSLLTWQKIECHVLRQGFCR